MSDRGHLANRPCIVPGCPDPRYEAGTYIKSRCRRHEAERVRARYAARLNRPVRSYRLAAQIEVIR